MRIWERVKPEGGEGGGGRERGSRKGIDGGELGREGREEGRKGQQKGEEGALITLVTNTKL